MFCKSPCKRMFSDSVRFIQESMRLQVSKTLRRVPGASGSIVKHHAKHMAQMRRQINAKTRGDSGSHVTVRSAKNIVSARGPC
jgi:GTP cyclohydrolase I